MTKTTAAIIPIISLLSLIILKYQPKKRDLLSFILLLLPPAFYCFTRTLPLVLNKKQVFMTSDSWLLSFKANLFQSIPWLVQYLTWPVVLLLILGIILAWLKHRQLAKIIIISLTVSFLFILITAKIFFPRYLLITYQSALILAAIGLIELIRLAPAKIKYLPLIFLFPSLLFVYQIVFNFNQAPWPEIERWQYITGWPSGYGLQELVAYLKSDTPNILITEKNDLIKSGLSYLWPQHPLQLQTMTQQNELKITLPCPLPSDQNIYLALNVLETLPSQFKGQLIKEFPRPENKSSIKLYLITDILW